MQSHKCPVSHSSGDTSISIAIFMSADRSHREAGQIRVKTLFTVCLLLFALAAFPFIGRGTPLSIPGYHLLSSVYSSVFGGLRPLAKTVGLGAGPSITPNPVTRHQNSASHTQIATVTDADVATVVVTVNGGTSATATGVTVSNITNNSGTIAADVTANCTATDASFTLTATNTGGATASATLNVTVTANTLPVLTYNAATVPTGGATTVNPATGPSDDVVVTSITVKDPGTYTGTISVNPGTGVVSISNAAPLGSHIITIRANDSCGSTDTQFTLQVSAADTNISLAGGNLTVSDANGNDNDQVTLSLNGPNVRINDPSHLLGCGAGGTSIDPHTCEVPLSSITGNIHVSGGGGNDTLTIALAGGNVFPPGGVTFDGGDPTTAPGDQLIITGGSQGTVTYHYNNAHDGTVTMSNFGTVTFTGLEPISNTGTASDVVFELPAGPNAATLGDDGTPVNGISQLSGSTFETTNFANPSGSLTIKRGDAADTVTVNALPDFNSSLTIGDAVNPFATISMNGNVSVTGSNSINLYAGDVSGVGNINTGAGLTVNNTGTASTLSGIISGSGAGLTKQGTGTLVLSGVDTYTGATSVSEGQLNLNGSITSDTTVLASATLGGTGTINSANSLTVTGGTVAPGTSPGILNTGNASFDSSSTFGVEIGGTTPGNTATNHDQLKVTGTIDLGSAQLQVSAFNGFVPSAGQSFTIIDNDGSDAVVGTFNGLAEGATIPNFLGVSTINAQITYQGGSGNDVVLTTVASPQEIDVQGNGISIPSGANSPNAADNTAFGFVTLGGSQSHTFTILNTGGTPLNLTGTPIVQVTGSSDFSVTTQPGSPVVAASGSTTFDVKYQPSSPGPATASITIANNDSDENPYVFTISGVTCPDTLTVNVATDEPDAAPGDGICDNGSGGCTLRAAIQEANASCVSTAVTIDATSVPSGIIILTDPQPLPSIQHDVNLNGPGADNLTVDANNLYQVFSINNGRVVNINGLSIAHGDAGSGSGGGVLNDGTLTMFDCNVFHNNAAKGGGIQNTEHGTLTILSSNIESNIANGDGAGIGNSGVMKLVNSLIAANGSNRRGGGILNDTGDGSGPGQLSITNSTIVGNIADGDNNNDTDPCPGDQPCQGGGIYNGSAVALVNTAVGGNFLGNQDADDIKGNNVNAASSHNLIGTGGSGGLTDGVNGNQVGVVDPHFGSGGIPEPGSPAIDRGDDCVLTDICSASTLGFNVTTDRFGQTRPQGPQVDIGAFELQEFVVNTTDDGDDGVCAPLGTGNGCSLREAINAANLTFNSAIFFGIPGTDPGCQANGVCTIKPTQGLPSITSQVFIDGYSQQPCPPTPTGPCSHPNTLHLDQGDDASLLIVIDGALVSEGAGLDLEPGSDGSTIRGFVLTNWNIAGVYINGSSDNNITGNFIGIDQTGTTAAGGSGGAGVVITSDFGASFSNIIGGDTPDLRNIISGNSTSGIDIGGPGGGGVADTSVEGNYIGTDRTGKVPVGNQVHGVIVENGTEGNTIGCEVLDGDNVISGNRDAGVYVTNTDACAIQGNFIGTDCTGTQAVANKRGVVLDNAALTFVGFPPFGNFISGNTTNGVELLGGSCGGNVVLGNFIGTDITGTAAVPNGGSGIYLNGASYNTIGTPLPGYGNLISGNGDEGIALLGASDNLIQGNSIGTDVNGNVTTIGNKGHGIEVYISPEPPAPSTDNVIGGEPDCGCVKAEKEIAQKTAAALARNQGRAASSGATKANSQNGAATNRQSNTATNSPLAALKQAASGWGARRTQTAFAWGRAPKTAAPQRASSKPTVIKQGAAIKQRSAPRRQDPEAPGVASGSGGNLIAGNTGDGVRVSSHDDINNLISENSIFSNGGLGINLGTDNVTLNDPGDPDEGPNHLQNFPVITTALPGTMTVSGTLDSTPDGSFTIEIFANDECDSPSGYGEGKTFLGSAQAIQVDGSPGQYTFQVTTFDTLAAGQILTATATDGLNNTSEFSQCFTTPTPDVSVTLLAPTSVAEDGPDNLVFEFTRNATAGPLTANFSVGGSATFGGAGADYTQSGADTFSSTSGTVTFPDGQATIDVTIDPIADTNPEPDETVTLTVAAGTGYNVGGPNTATGTITNDDSCPTTFLVNSLADTDDTAPGDGHCDTDGNLGNGDQCTLRAAITEANALGSCGPITIDATALTGTINLATVLPDINHDVSIKGSGATTLTVRRTGVPAFRIFTVAPTRIVSMSGVTITNGSDTVGGGIYNNHGTLTIDGCEITGNAATSEGGGVYNGGTGPGTAILTITNSTISGNSSAVDGGGVHSEPNLGSDTLTMTNCTVSGNTANGNGGGVVVNSSLATLTNVTITNNHADNDGNASGTGGGLSATGADFTLRNTIVAGNLRGGSSSTTRDDCNGSLNNGGKNNLIGDGTGMTGLGNAVNGNQVGSSGSPVNAFLGSLIYNGGTTRTHGLLYNSPAIDTGDDTVTGVPLNLTKDQRGLPRPADGNLTAGAHVDIGAYERQATETRNVPSGSNINIDLNDARVTFPCAPAGCGTGNRRDTRASSAGVTPDVSTPAVSIMDIDPSTQPLPPGFLVGNNSNPPLPSFDVSTTTSFDPPATVCFYLPVITDPAFFSNLKLFHNEGGTLVDRTSSLNFAARLACAQVSSFSVFVIAEGVSPTAADATVNGQIFDDHGNPVEGAAVRLSGTQNRLTITDAGGNYHFDQVETNGFYLVTPSRANFTFSPAQKSFSQLGAHTEATFTGAANSSGANPLDTTEYFVRQQYLDFLGREPDESGFNFWVNNIESCGADPACREVKRIDTSAAFFLSIESQQTGYLVYRTYESAYGNASGAPVPIKLNEFKPDTQEISKGVVVLQSGWQQKLENNKQAFISEFVQRARFTTTYPAAMTPAQFVDRLFANAHVDSSDPVYGSSIAEFAGAADTSDVAARARVLRRIAENSTLTQAQFNPAFVLMQYFGYLRRDPNSAPDADFGGFQFWLNKLDQFHGNFEGAEMVKAFLAAGEYRGRFPR
jgi:CSLREA domain-containing protein